MAHGALLDALEGASHVRLYRKNELVIRQGEITDNINILADGLLAGYYYNEEGKALVSCFCFKEGDIAVPPHDMSVPSQLSIKAIEDSTIVRIPVKQFKNIMDEFPEIQRIYINELTKALEKHNSAKYAMQEYSGKKLFEWFLMTYPQLIDMIPHKYIASFLGITPVHLSRLVNEK